MATNIDAKKYNLIVEDVISNISKTSITDKDLDSVKFKIKKKINKKSYTFSELTTVVKELKSKIVKVKFSKSDIRGAANKARSKILQLSNALGGLDDLKGLTMQEKGKVILKLIFINVRDEFKYEFKDNYNKIEDKPWFSLGFRNMCNFWFVSFWKYVEKYEKIIEKHEKHGEKS